MLLVAAFAARIVAVGVEKPPTGLRALRGVLTKISHIDGHTHAVGPSCALALSDRHANHLHGDVPEGPTVVALEKLEPDVGEFIQRCFDFRNATRRQGTGRIPTNTVV